MVPSPRTVLLGRERTRRPFASVALVVALFGGTFAAYALGLFAVSGGVVFLPGHAALVGVLGAALVGSRHGGLVVAWLATYAALLGYSADHYLLGLSGRSLSERVTAFLGLDGLVFLGVEALVLGTLGFLLGACCARGFALVRDGPTGADAG